MAATYAVETTKSFSFLNDFLEDDEEVIIEKLKVQAENKKLEQEKNKQKEKNKSKNEVTKSSKPEVVTTTDSTSTFFSNSNDFVSSSNKGKGNSDWGSQQNRGSSVAAAGKVNFNANVNNTTKKGVSFDNAGFFPAATTTTSSGSSSVKGRGGSISGSGSFRGGLRGGTTGPRGGNSGRVYDRHSGSDVTGVKAVMKRDGHGSHNWGCDDDEIKEATVAVTEVTANDTQTEVDITNKDEIVEETIAAPVVATVTVEEFLRNNKDRQEKILHLNKNRNNDAVLRMPNEGKDPFKGMQAYRKNKDEEEDDDIEEEEEEETNLQKKQVLNVNISFARNRGVGGRSGAGSSSRGAGRGGERGTGSRGGGGRFRGAAPRGGGSRNAGGMTPVNLQLDNDLDFPALA